MTFLSGSAARVPIAPRADGQVFPNVGAREVRVLHDRCTTCDKLDAHGKPCILLGSKALHGDTRNALIPSASRIDADFLGKMQSELWRMGAVANGPVGLEFIYNLGVGNNMMQSFSFEVLEVDSTNARRVRLRGEDPRALPVTIARINPDWPFEGGRIITEPGAVMLPLGAFVLFDFPSVLYRKMTPWIEEWEAPSGSIGGTKSFWVTLSRSAKNAREPWDAAFPSSVYTATVLAYVLSPEGFENVQGLGFETTFVRRTQAFIASNLVAGKLELTNTNGDPGRVALPEMGPNLVRCVVLYDGDTDPTPIVTDGKVSTVGTSGGWITTLDLSGDLVKDGKALVSGTVNYFSETIDGDAGDIVLARSSCANSQRDSTGAYRCMAPDCTRFQAGDYLPECWASKDLASRFTLTSPALPAGDFGRSQFGRMWSRECLFLSQGVAGQSSSRNLSFSRPPGGGPSIQQLLGGFIDSLPPGPGEASNVPWFGPHFGQRRQFTDDGVLTHELVHGAFYTSRTGTQGAIPAEVSGWSSRDNARGVSATGTDEVYPSLHGPPMNLQTRSTGFDPSGEIKRATVATQVLHITGLDPEGSSDLAASIRSRLP